MASIGGVGGASSAWAGQGASRAEAMKQRMFSKVDADGSKGVDASELASMLLDLAAKTGTEAGDASELMTKMDGDGNGSLSADELDAGMKRLMPPPASTMQFVQQRHGDAGAATEAMFDTHDADGDEGVSSEELSALLEEIGGAAGSSGASVLASLDTDGDGTLSKGEFAAGIAGSEGMAPPGGMEGAPPPGEPPPGGGAGSASGSRSDSDDALDTNGDGIVSALERIAGAESASGTEAASSRDVLAALREFVVQAYSQAASAASPSTLDVAA